MSSINSFSTKWWANNYNKCDKYGYSFVTISEEIFVSRDRHCLHPTCHRFDMYLFVFVTEIITFVSVSDSDSKEKYEDKYYVGDNRLYLVLLHP